MIFLLILNLIVLAKIMKLNKKIREGEKEWIPLMLVIGEKEAKAKKYPIRVRNGNDFSATVKELIQAMNK